MLISLFAAMSMAMNARIIDYNTDDGFKYKLNTEEKTATLSRYSGSAKEVCIPDSITYSEETFTVTYLGNSCFYNCTSLTSINIPTSVTSLGAGCFYKCTSLTSIDIPSSVQILGYECFRDCTSLTSINIPSLVGVIGKWCFRNCTSLKTMICEISSATLGTEYYSDFFEDTPIKQATLYVPETSLESYKTTSPWSGFGKILPISPDGIKKTTTDKETTIGAIYNLEGKRRNGIRSGINIIRMSDGTTKKVLK